MNRLVCRCGKTKQTQPLRCLAGCDDGPNVRRLAATLLLELGRVPDPRLSELRPTTIADVLERGPVSTTLRGMRPLTAVEVELVLSAYFGCPTSLAGE